MNVLGSIGPYKLTFIIYYKSQRWASYFPAKEDNWHVHISTLSQFWTVVNSHSFYLLILFYHCPLYDNAPQNMPFLNEIYFEWILCCTESYFFFRLERILEIFVDTNCTYVVMSLWHDVTMNILMSKWGYFHAYSREGNGLSPDW